MTNSEQGFVSTRFVGSKRRIANWISQCTSDLAFSSVLDAFGGTGSVSFEFKDRNKKVIYNDMLKTCFYSGLALIENSGHRLSSDELDGLLCEDEGNDGGRLAAYDGLFYTMEENRWIDTTVKRINNLHDKYHKALAFHALTQSCLVKRPFNLFHRKNLYLRLADVKRSFNNKSSWEKPFPDLFKYFVIEANARVFSNGQPNQAKNRDVFSIRDLNADMVYLDPPYVHPTGRPTNYYEYYGFLEWMYDGVDCTLDDYLSRKRESQKWTRATVTPLLNRLFSKFRDSIIVLSYRSPGIPNQATIRELLSRFKKVTVFERKHQYVLSNRIGEEVLFIGV